jgi:hypothetical protein
MKTKNKEINSLIVIAEKQGWNITQSRSGHIKWLSPTGAIVFSAFSPSDRHAYKNIKKQLIAKGIEIKKGK